MGRKVHTELNEKHWESLKLLESGLTRKEVAAQMGWSYEHFEDMCQGNVKSIGQAADLFKKELQKLEEKRDANIKFLVSRNIEAAQTLIHASLDEYKGRKKLTHEEKKLIATINNSLNKSTPTVNIKSLSYSYTQGLNPEDLIHEFQRLKSIAENSFAKRIENESRDAKNNTVLPSDGRGIQEPEQG